MAQTCERLELPYFVTGSVASTFYGEPRTTLDVDLGVAIPSARIGAFCAAFPHPEFYVEETAVRAAVETCGLFNIIAAAEGAKADINVLADTPFNRSRFSRARRATMPGGFGVMIASPEDVILKKLEYYREGGSDKHLRDAAGVLTISGEMIDRDYIGQWARRLGVEAHWRTVLDRSSESGPSAAAPAP